jgi:hypothetical protein
VVVADSVGVYQVVFTGSVIDETTGSPVVSTPVMNVDMRGIRLRATADALIAGAAVTSDVFPEIATKGYNFTLSISASGSKSVKVPIAIPIAAIFPLVLPAIVMRRNPIRLQGRVVRASDRSAVSNATIASKVQTLLLLREPLRFPHAAGTTVRSVALTDTGAPATLADAVVAGDRTLALSTNAGLAPGSIVQLGGINGAIYSVAAVGAGPSMVTLSEVVTLSAPAGATVQALTASAPTGASTIVRNADAGDGLAIMAAAVTGTAIQVLDGARTEFHRLNAVSGPDGYFRVDGVTGVRMLDLLCSAPTFTTFDQQWTPNYSQSAAIVDFLLRP